ncbi:hypothetical protein MGYG_01834 [Nannizzia gypsea CBS 118893]|uniref:Uncharacterized protein n=1 Tax=Arthroderma gypseum (strain ATCC MYA-4604 / CBS 118893) TaxID=535722 RepID=E5R3X3_ARTGP|nr:hypothetical protein MGYG_01834 [Nannizzia gypsea CBS 118893]EFQ98819.1 hypothetical protein MGYG_01834 [Nannizzia gypsea CBS 118893]
MNAGSQARMVKICFAYFRPQGTALDMQEHSMHMVAQTGDITALIRSLWLLEAGLGAVDGRITSPRVELFSGCSKLATLNEVARVLKGPKRVENQANEGPFGMLQMFQAVACGLVQHPGPLVHCLICPTQQVKKALYSQPSRTRVTNWNRTR